MLNLIKRRRSLFNTKVKIYNYYNNCMCTQKKKNIFGKTFINSFEKSKWQIVYSPPPNELFSLFWKFPVILLQNFKTKQGRKLSVTTRKCENTDGIFFFFFKTF